MARKIAFGNRTIELPGAYARIISGIKNPALALSFGNLLVIDTGSGATFGGLAGVNGEYSQDKNSLYTFNNIDDFRTYIGGGLWWLLAEPLFRPNGAGFNGISSITYVRAATTTSATITIAFNSAGSFSFDTKDEGLVANGTLTNNELTKGHAFKMRAGVLDTSKFIFDFYKGTFKGLDQDSQPYDGIAQANTRPRLVTSSPEVSTTVELKAWMETDPVFNANYTPVTLTVNGAGTIESVDLTTYTTYTLASGGTETYDTTDVDDALDAVQDLYFDFILADQYGADAQDANNVKIQAFIESEARIKPDLYIAAGATKTDFDAVGGSIATAIFYNSENVTVVHGAPQIRNRTGLKTMPTIYKAAALLGREAGLAPQVPLTFKSIKIQGEVHELTTKEAIRAKNAGLLVTRRDGNNFAVVDSVNSTQANNFFINDDGSSFSKQIKRIKRQLNKELIINIQENLMKSETGINRNTLSQDDIQEYVKTYLKSVTATDNIDNLILSFQSVTVNAVDDIYQVTYEFTPNSEIRYILITGLLTIDNT